MKRIFCLVVTALLLFSLTSCSIDNSGRDQALFYFCRVNYSYREKDSVITAEQRDITGHAGDLTYLLSLYLVGPLDEELASPFPSRTQLLSAEAMEDTLNLELSDTAKSLTDAQFSLACACLTMTCMELTEVSQVTIISGDRIITLGSEELLLYDEIPSAQTTPTEETQ